MNWFYESGGQQQGPVSDDDLDRLLAQGTITLETLVWREGLADWKPLRVARPVAGAAETVQCASCGQYKPAEEIIQIGQRSICAACKPAVLLSVQQGGGLPTFADGRRNGPAWEQRDTLGFWKALWLTIRNVLTLPSETFSMMKREGGLNAPLLYFLVTGGAGMTVVLIVECLYFRFVVPELKGLPVEVVGNLQMFTGLPAMLACLVLGPISAALAAFLGSGILHLCLMLCRAARQPFETTFRVYCYGYGSALALNVIPIFGMMVSWIWSRICLSIGAARAHEVTTGRAVLAVLLPYVVCCVLYIGFFAIMVGIAISSGAGHH